LDTFEELLRAADVAMYRAKASGKNRYSIFNDSFRSEAVRRAHIISEVESGIAEDQFEIFFQPIVTLPEGRLRGAEALVRWKHPTKGILGPSDFIPVAEESGTIIPLGLHILTLSCDWLAETKEDLPIGFDLHVNVAARQLYDGEFPNVLAGIVKARELDAHHVVIEVTETGLMPNVSAINDTLGGIARMGFAIAIDDFGTGSSSLAHLRQLPINILKIDSSFVRRIQPHNKTAPISRAVIQLGKSLGFETIAEGIETRLQARVLTRLGCRLGQGYLFGRPMPSASFIEMARDQTRSSALLSTSLVSAGRGAS
jgi:EAL domain-containing protein (putative c-di-GMP-specific phosphodiesterase class I)